MLSARSRIVITAGAMSLEAAAPPKQAHGFWQKHGIKLGVSVVIAVAFAWTLQRGGLPLLPPRDAFRGVKIVNCIECIALIAVLHTFRATRWRHLLSPIADLPLRRILAVSWIGFAAILLMPLRAGEIVRPYMIRQKGKVSIAAATGTVGAERVIDGLCLTLLLGVCMQLARPLSPLPDHIGKLQIPVAAVAVSAYVSLLGFVCAFGLMGLFYWRPVLGHKFVEKTLGLVSHRVAQKAADFVARTVEGLKFLPNLRHFGPFLLETTFYWL